MIGHVVRDLPAALGFAAVVAAVAAHPPAVLSRAPLRVGRWRPWTRRVPSPPAELHVKPVPSVA